MSNTDDSIKIYSELEKFGLNQEESDVLIFLMKHGKASVLNISKELNKPRTTTYNLLEKLRDMKLIIEVLDPRGKRYEANKISQLDLIIKQKESDIDLLKQSAETIKDFFTQASPSDIIKTKFIPYKGLEGLRQITWNSSKAKNELRILENSTMDEFLNFGFSEKARSEFLRNKVYVKEICNDKVMPEWTDVTEFVTDFWEPRYIPKEIFNIDFEILIYNDVYSIYNHKNNDIIGIEIYNQTLADMQRQLFDFLWSQSKPMKKVNHNGKATIDY